MRSVVTFGAGLSNAHGCPEPWWLGDLGKDRSQWPGAGREAEESGLALAPEARGSRNPAARGAGTGLGLEDAHGLVLCPPGPPPARALEPGSPQGQRGLHPAPRRPATLSVPGLTQAAQPVLQTFGDPGSLLLVFIRRPGISPDCD